MPYAIVLARSMTTLDLEFEKALYYHDEGYKSDNDFGLPVQFMGPVCIYSGLTTKASFNSANYQGAQCPIPLFTPR